MTTSLPSIEARIQAACKRAGRERSTVALVGASKRQPIERLHTAYADGLRCFGENRVQEAAEKMPLLPADIDWHLIGPLQSNKAGRAAELFSTIHSIDRWKIARALDQNAAKLDRTLGCFLQVNLGAEDNKSGFSPAQVLDPQIVTPLLELERLNILGLMAIPPRSKSEAEARRWFRELAALSREAQAEFEIGEGLSMGMSSDFETAIEEGATHIRLGSTLFGERRPL